MEGEIAFLFSTVEYASQDEDVGHHRESFIPKHSHRKLHQPDNSVLVQSKYLHFRPRTTCPTFGNLLQEIDLCALWLLQLYSFYFISLFGFAVFPPAHV
jgi:hypothetical protein